MTLNTQTITLLGIVVVSPVVTLLTIFIKDKMKLTEKSQSHEFDKENKLIDVLQQDIAELRKQVKDLEKGMQKKDDEIREIQRRLNAREVDYANLLKEHAELSQNYQNLQVEHDDLEKKYQETVEKLSTLSADHETLKKKTVESAKHMIAPTDAVTTTQKDEQDH